MQNTLEEALKVAVVEAFFVQKTYYDGNGAYHSYGGQLAPLVEKVVSQLSLDDISEAIVSLLNSPEHKDKFLKMAVEKAHEMVGRGYSSLNSELRNRIQDALAKMILESDDLRLKLLKGVDLENKNITITVTISDKK